MSSLELDRSCFWGLTQGRTPGSVRRSGLADTTVATECSICEDSLPLFTLAPTASCSHPGDLCRECLRQTIRAAITDGSAVGGITCPSYHCNAILDYEDVRRWGGELFTEYDYMLLRKELLKDARYVRCLQPGCLGGHLHEGGGDNPIVTCTACRSKQCFTHQSHWHEGYTCDAWDTFLYSRMQDDNLSESLIAQSTKCCPGPNCGRKITKVGGCDHMICKPPGGCGFEFCWSCLAPYKPIIRFDNSLHYDHCPYYSGAPGMHPAPQNLQVTTYLSGNANTQEEWDGFNSTSFSAFFTSTSSRQGMQATQTPAPEHLIDYESSDSDINEEDIDHENVEGHGIDDDTDLESREEDPSRDVVTDDSLWLQFEEIDIEEVLDDEDPNPGSENHADHTQDEAGDDEEYDEEYAEEYNALYEEAYDEGYDEPYYSSTSYFLHTD